MAEFTDMKSWTGRLGHSRLRTFHDRQGHFWLEQNSAKTSRWAKLARDGHQIAWEFDSPGGAYTGRLLIDGEVYPAGEAVKKFFMRSMQRSLSSSDTLAWPTAGAPIWPHPRFRSCEAPSRGDSRRTKGESL